MGIAKPTSNKTKTAHRRSQQEKYSFPSPRLQHKADKHAMALTEKKLEEAQQMKLFCKAFMGMLVIDNPIQEVSDRFETLSVDEQMMAVYDEDGDVIMMEDPIQKLIDELTPKQLELQQQQIAAEMKEHERFNNQKWWTYSNQVLEKQQHFSLGDQTPIWF